LLSAVISAKLSRNSRFIAFFLISESSESMLLYFSLFHQREIFGKNTRSFKSKCIILISSLFNFCITNHCINFIYKYRECCKKCCKNIIIIVRPSRTIVMCVDTFFQAHRGGGTGYRIKLSHLTFPSCWGNDQQSSSPESFPRQGRKTRKGDRTRSAHALTTHNRGCDFTTSKLRLSKYRISGLSWLLDKLQNCRPFYRMYMNKYT